MTRSIHCAFLVLIVASFATGCASNVKQASFATPDDAVGALITAARADSTEELKRIFGPDSDPLVSSGDAVADRNAVDRFVRDFEEKHSLQTNPDGSMTLVVGEKDWPFPVPIVKDNGTWSFDTSAGMDEIINRRIGRNELSAMQVCLAISDAQREYAQTDPNGDGIPEYARKFLSDPGKRDGLYWAPAEGEPASPLGELVADAEAEGYSAARSAGDTPRPYHGYLYHILTSQSAAADGGAYDYDVGGHLIGGFGVIAYPAEYGVSGIMTFITNHNGALYQRDLGDQTNKICRDMTRFDPGPGWTRVDPVPPAP